MKSIVTVIVSSRETGQDIATYSVKTKGEGRRVQRLLQSLDFADVEISVQAKTVEYDGDVATVAKAAMLAISEWLSS